MSDCELLPSCSKHLTEPSTTPQAHESTTVPDGMHPEQDNSDADSFIEVENDKGKARVQSHDETASTLWSWTQETFGDNAHLMFEELCKRLQIPERTSRKIRRRSMPAVPNPNSALKRDDQANNDSVAETVQPRARSHSFTAETKPVMNDTTANDSSFIDDVPPEFDGLSTAMNHGKSPTDISINR